MLGPAARAGEPDSGAPVVTLDTRGPADPDLEDTLRELFGRHGVVLARAGASGRVMARVRIEQNSAGAVVVVEDPRHETVRREVDRGSSPGLFRETLAPVIAAAGDPLLTGAGRRV